MITYEQYISACRSTDREIALKIELLDKNENVIDNLTDDFIDGSVTMTLQNGQRRSASLTLMNINNKYTPKAKGKIWLDKKIKIWAGLKINREDYLFPQGVFCIGDPRAGSYFSDTTVTLDLKDKWSYLNGVLKGVLKTDYIINVGENVGNAVRDIILNEAKDVKSPIIVPTTVTSPYTLTLNRGDNYAEMLLKLAGMVSYQIYYNKDGRLVFQPVADDNKRPSVWNFGTEEVNYLGSERTFEFTKIKNDVHVYGNNINGSQVYGHTQDNYIFSDTKIALVEERVLVIEDEVINTNDLAQQRANYELRKATTKNESVSMPCISLYHLNEEEIVTIQDNGNGLNRDRYLIQNITKSLKYDVNMPINLWKVRPLE